MKPIKDITYIDFKKYYENFMKVIYYNKKRHIKNVVNHAFIYKDFS